MGTPYLTLPKGYEFVLSERLKFRWMVLSHVALAGFLNYEERETYLRIIDTRRQIEPNMRPLITYDGAVSLWKPISGAFSISFYDYCSIYGFLYVLEKLGIVDDKNTAIQAEVNIISRYE